MLSPMAAVMALFVDFISASETPFYQGASAEENTH